MASAAAVKIFIGVSFPLMESSPLKRPFWGNRKLPEMFQNVPDRFGQAILPVEASKRTAQRRQPFAISSSRATASISVELAPRCTKASKSSPRLSRFTGSVMENAMAYASSTWAIIASCCGLATPSAEFRMKVADKTEDRGHPHPRSPAYSLHNQDVDDLQRVGLDDDDAAVGENEIF